MNQGLEQVRAFGRRSADGAANVSVGLLVGSLRGWTRVEDTTADWPRLIRNLVRDAMRPASYPTTTGDTE